MVLPANGLAEVDRDGGCNDRSSPTRLPFAITEGYRAQVCADEGGDSHCRYISTNDWKETEWTKGERVLMMPITFLPG